MGQGGHKTGGTERGRDSNTLGKSRRWKLPRKTEKAETGAEITRWRVCLKGGATVHGKRGLRSWAGGHLRNRSVKDPQPKKRKGKRVTTGGGGKEGEQKRKGVKGRRVKRKDQGSTLHLCSRMEERAATLGGGKGKRMGKNMRKIGKKPSLTKNPAGTEPTAGKVWKNSSKQCRVKTRVG